MGLVRKLVSLLESVEKLPVFTHDPPGQVLNLQVRDGPASFMFGQQYEEVIGYASQVCTVVVFIPPTGDSPPTTVLPRACPWGSGPSRLLQEDTPYRAPCLCGGSGEVPQWCGKQSLVLVLGYHRIAIYWLLML